MKNLLLKLKNYGTRLALDNMTIDDIVVVQESLNQMGANLTVDGVLGPITIHAIKQVNNKKLHKKIWINKYGNIEDVDIHPFILQPYQYRWIDFILSELNVTEIPGPKSNHRIDQYHKTIGLPWAKDDVPWCGSFMGFIMLKAGYKLPPKPARALSWAQFGKKVSKPVYGAIAVKKRKGGGHVTCVIGQIRNGKYLICVGGNQNDSVKLSVYKASVFKYFRVPNDYPSKPKQLPEYHNMKEAYYEVKES